MSELNGVLFGDTITLYNRYRENREDRWQRTVICGVQYRAKTEKTVDASGLHLAKAVSVTIPVDADASGRHYLPPPSVCNERQPHGLLVAGCRAQLGRDRDGANVQRNSAMPTRSTSSKRSTRM